MRRLNRVFCVALLAGITAPATADFTYELSVKFNGSTPASPSLPWTEATFEQVGGDVRLTLSATNLIPEEFISEWYFNVQGVDPTHLVFTPSGVLPFTVLDIQQQSDAFQADGDGLFDIRFDFIHTVGPGDQFVGQEVGTWIISHSDSTVDLNPEMFYDRSVSAMNGGIEGLYTAAHLGRIDTGDEGNSWITVPAPGAALLGAVGLSVIYCVKRRYL